MASKFTQEDVAWDTTLNSPGSHHAAITPSDTVNMTNHCRGIYVGVAGNIAILSVNDELETYIAASAGSVIPIQAKRVNLTDTTASSLIAMW
jgi:hypothetical protein